jgi:hypothetical protein
MEVFRCKIKKVIIKNNYLCRMKSKGLGDTIDKITTAPGLKKVVKAVSKAAGKDCGCAARREKLNKAMPYK